MKKTFKQKLVGGGRLILQTFCHCPASARTEQTEPRCQKLNRTKGFTLIELLVVISIIGLLSSVVLASVQSAREKAMLAKTVSEMKSFQNAIELYRSQMGYYPDEINLSYSYGNYDDDINGKLINAWWTAGKSDSFFTTELVNKKLISKVPHAPNYPNNCGSDCGTRGYILGYSIFDSNYSTLHKNNTTSYFTCGGKKVDNYFIYFYANIKKINLPILGYNENGYYYDILPDWFGTNGNIYCMAM